MHKLLTSNSLKLIAFIIMVIDHFGYFFVDIIPYNTYIFCRCIGRIAMPLFAFLIIEGIVHTSNIKKYLVRLTIVAVITQIVITIENYINIELIGKPISVAYSLNIVFSFCLLVMLIALNNSWYSKSNSNKLLSILISIIIVFIYLFIPIDYGVIVPLMGILMYLSIKIRENNIFVYDMLVLLSLFIPLVFNGMYSLCVFLSYPFILLYNGKKGSTKKNIPYFYYIAFPLQYALIYFIFVTKALIIR